MIYFALALLFVICQGFFSGMETGMVSVLRPRAEHEALKGKKSAQLIVFFLHRPETLIATALIGVNVSVVLASLMVQQGMKSLGFSGNCGSLLASVVLSIVLLTCEILPKNWFRDAAFERCSFFIRLLYFFYILLFVPVWIFSHFTAFLNKLAGLIDRRKKNSKEMLARENFRLYLRESKSYGVLDQQTASIVERAIDFPSREAVSVMIPKKVVKSVPENMTVREAFLFCHKNDLVNVPVYSEKQGEWVGCFSLYDAIYTVEEMLWDTQKVSQCMKKLSFVSEHIRTGEMIEQMKLYRIAFFVVRNSKRKQCGIVRPEELAAMLFE